MKFKILVMKIFGNINGFATYYSQYIIMVDKKYTRTDVITNK